MKILVTGGNGLVGKAMQKIAPNYPYEFVFWSREDCDLFDFSNTIQELIKLKPDCIIHLAANVGGLYKNMHKKVIMFEDNLIINMNVVRACHLIKAKFVGCLSTCIFPDRSTYPITEEMLFCGEPHDSNYAYAYAKRMLEIHCRTYREQFGCDFRCFIPTNIYGPYDNFNLDDAHVIPALIHRCFLAKQNNQDFVVFGTGNPLRQFMYSEDFANIILREMNSDNLEPVIVAPSQEISIGHAAYLVAKNFGYEDRIRFDHTKSDGQLKKTAASKIQYNYKDINEGIKETVEWFIENYYYARR